MTRQRAHKSAIAAAGCLSLVLALGGAVDVGAAVLCVGFDGHVDVEYLLAGCCLSNPVFSDLANPGTVVSGAPACGSCVDLQVSDQSLKREKSQNSAPKTGVVNDASRNLVCSTGCRQILVVDGIDHHSDVLAPLSTIILLI